MATVRLPESLQPGVGARYSTFGELQLAICSRHSIEVPVVEWNGVRHVRPCCQVYNRPEQYERLADAIEALAREAA
jgi:isopenicillin-N epimerase